MVEHTETMRVGWIDTDASGRIHYTVAFRWVGVAETGLLRKLGLLTAPKPNLPRAHVEADYRRPLWFDDEVAVRIGVESVGRTSIRFTWDVTHDGEIAITGAHAVVLVDDAGRPAPVDDELRRLLAS